ncbi:metallophosphoesterase family protein [Methylobacterium sp. SyP6R]|uniref:metallophosphoesterase family protein n=1 Tax=Methylobacterium sp. SyP6R TaxID=2718876 RepID=UPI001F28226F|nr:metallophosphoesterase [Methylobacterium sp. SyP6R]MCF4128475.1 metallophosphoesterase [Methylobacterium sp. SyP6R]
MRNRPLRILQIGDIHFPEAISNRPDADLKRDPFDISDEIAPIGLRIQKISESFSQYEEQYFDAIAFMGDYTTGNPDLLSQMQSMEECIDYLDRNVIKILLGKHGHARSIFVPGNHDVDRTKCPSSSGDRYGKFQYYIEKIGKYGYAHNSAENISVITAKQGELSAFIYGINTCIGCGEFLSFPDSMRAELSNRLKDILRSTSDKQIDDAVNSFMDLTERLDAPLIDSSILHKLDNLIIRNSNENPSSVHVVVGHHNLLPQTVPRIALFSELMNSGELRSFLASKDDPIIYLHGHIHQDPIEVVFSQSNPTSCVISISAPEFINGYNVLEIHFSEDGSPLGLVINAVRQDSIGKMTRLEPRRIPFRQGPHRIAAITELARRMFHDTFASNSQLHFGDVCKKYPLEPEDAIERALLELEWLGLVQIANRNRASKRWNIGSAI